MYLYRAQYRPIREPIEFNSCRALPCVGNTSQSRAVRRAGWLVRVTYQHGIQFEQEALLMFVGNYSRELKPIDSNVAAITEIIIRSIDGESINPRVEPISGGASGTFGTSRRSSFPPLQ